MCDADLAVHISELERTDFLQILSLKRFLVRGAEHSCRLKYITVIYSRGLFLGTLHKNFLFARYCDCFISFRHRVFHNTRKLYVSINLCVSCAASKQLKFTANLCPKALKRIRCIECPSTVHAALYCTLLASTSSYLASTPVNVFSFPPLPTHTHNYNPIPLPHLPPNLHLQSRLRLRHYGEPHPDSGPSLPITSYQLSVTLRIYLKTFTS